MLTSGPKDTDRIDRLAVVNRHNVVLNATDAECPLQVGNGRFAFNVDVTGLQTFYGNILSDWGWHAFPLPEGISIKDRTRSELITHGRKRYYLSPVPDEQKVLADWLDDNPHRLNLGRLRFVDGNGKTLQVADLSEIHQQLDLWHGIISSRFIHAGETARVETCVHPELSLVAVHIDSPLVADGRLRVALDLPYPEHDDFPYVPPDGRMPSWYDRKRTKDQEIRIAGQTTDRIDLVRRVDRTIYYVTIAATSQGSRFQSSTGGQSFILQGEGSTDLTFVCAFNGQPLPSSLPSFTQTKEAAAQSWADYWLSGGMIDLSGSQDPRWKELERRVVLSLYATRVNSTGMSPPQESGLLRNSWDGKFHLEMTAWHGAHFVLWGREHLLDGWVKWYRDIGLPAARREAQAEGWKGAKWLKTSHPSAEWEAWILGTNRVTQNAHPFYFAELFYRAQPTRQTLEAWKDIIFETAAMMADFMYWDEASKRFIMGPPVMSGAESNTGFASYNSTSELNYWAMSLEIAQRWRERLGLPREPQWDHILQHLSRPPVHDGVYVNEESDPTVWSVNSDGRFIRPAWAEVYGCVRGPLIDPRIMEKTYERIAADLRAGKWLRNIWGCDFSMMAMTAARLERPVEAVDWLLFEERRNQYTANGLCYGWYLPGNGGLLWAVAMMAAGWDNSPQRHAPGFPDDGRWVIRHENLRPSP